MKQIKLMFKAFIFNKLSSVKSNRRLFKLAHNTLLKKFTKKNKAKMHQDKLYEPIAVSN